MSIRISNLYKRYGSNVILNNISFHFLKNTKYLIEGVNGSGKTTLIKCILKQIEYDGFIDCDKEISYCPDTLVFPNYVSVYSFIKCFSQLTNKNKNFEIELEECLTMFNMTKYKYSFIGGLSKGQKQKINIINSLLKHSDILILDEPTNGLDLESKNYLVEELNKTNKTVLLISHEELNGLKDFIKLRICKNEITKIS